MRVSVDPAVVVSRSLWTARNSPVGIPRHGRSMMHDGLSCLTGSPADLNRPVFGSIRNTATLSPGMFAQRSHSPSRVIARFCGPFPRLGLMAISDSRPSSPILYAAMLSCPRFVP